MDVPNTPKIESHLQLIEQISSYADDRNLSARQTQQHLSWILRFFHFHNNSPVSSLGKEEIERYLSYLANELNYSREVQMSAHAALIFLFSDFLQLNLGQLNFTKQKRRNSFIKRFGEPHCHAVINNMTGSSKLVVKLASLANLKLREVINLRLADIDFKKNEILVRHPNGQKNFIVNIPMVIILDLRIQSIKVHSIVQQEKERELGNQPSQLAILAQHLEPEWQYLFPYGYQVKSNRSHSQKSSQLNQTPLSIVKNDLQLAIKAYQRTQPDMSGDSTGKVNKQLKIRKIRSELQNENLTNQKLKQKSPQVSFAFAKQLGAA